MSMLNLPLNLYWAGSHFPNTIMKDPTILWMHQEEMRHWVKGGFWRSSDTWIPLHPTWKSCIKRSDVLFRQFWRLPSCIIKTHTGESKSSDWHTFLQHVNDSDVNMYVLWRHKELMKKWLIISVFWSMTQTSRNRTKRTHLVQWWFRVYYCGIMD